MDLKGIDLLALMPCPLKVPFGNRLNEYLKEKEEKEGIVYNCWVDANVNNHEAIPNREVFSALKKAADEEDLPEIIFTTGLNSLFFSDFKKRFMGKHVFKDVLGNIDTHFNEYQYPDPRGEYTMLTLNPLVMVANLNKLGERSVPEKWSDLLEPAFYKDIIIRGNKNMYCETVMLTLYKNHGLDAMELFKENLLKGLHPAEMVKDLARSEKDAAAIYVMPSFFADKLKKKDGIQIIWPEEGALLNPVSMLVKENTAPKIKELAEFIAGEEMGQIFTKAAFPAVNGKTDISEYLNKKLMWIGWDSIYNDDLGSTVDGINRYFLKGGQLHDI